jgi:hypothetical protein
MIKPLLTRRTPHSMYNQATMANLFGRNKLKEKASKISTEEVIPLLDIVKSWHHDYHHGSLKTDKEDVREQSYNKDFFTTILGYKQKPSLSYTFVPKIKTELSGKPEVDNRFGAGRSTVYRINPDKHKS